MGRAVRRQLVTADFSEGGKHMFGLQNKVAFITGAGSGLGLASAKMLAKHGATVMLAGRSEAPLAAAAEALKDAGGKASHVRCDISSEESIAAAIARTVSEFGKLDILLNNAALTDLEAMAKDTDVCSMTVELWDRVMATNVRGPMLCCKHAIPEMLKQGGGSIIIMSSTYGVKAHTAQVAYGVSKGALNTLTLYIATTYGKQGIRCNAVVPSMIRTEITDRFMPLEHQRINEDSALTPYLGEPDDVAHAVAYLASDGARFVTGQLMMVDGGTLAHLPTYSDTQRLSGA